MGTEKNLWHHPSSVVLKLGGSMLALKRPPEGSESTPRVVEKTPRRFSVNSDVLLSFI